LSREAFVSELTRRLRLGEDGAVQKGIAAVGLSLIESRAKLEPDLLNGLEPTARQQIQRFHEVSKQLASDLLAGTTRLDRRQVLERIRGMFAALPISIQQLDLCRSVQGFGIYEPFDDHRFLADQPQKVIVYTELDHFKAVERENRYEVKLKQEIILFNASDGLAVWSHEPVTILDRSRNKRQDFFTVQLVTLPERLGVGEYQLKVRITDMHGGSVDETTVPVELVADRAMADGSKKAPP
jgi:hypothetical protein